MGVQPAALPEKGSKHASDKSLPDAQSEGPDCDGVVRLVGKRLLHVLKGVGFSASVNFGCRISPRYPFFADFAALTAICTQRGPA